MSKISVKLFQVNFGHTVSLEIADITTSVIIIIHYIIDGTPPSLNIRLKGGTYRFIVPHHSNFERIPLQATAEMGKEHIAMKNHS